MSVARDATTTPAPDETIVRAALRALIAQLPPVLRAEMAPVPALRAETVPLHVAMAIAVRVVIRSVMGLLVVTVRLRLAATAHRAATAPLHLVVTADIRSETVLRAAMTGAPVDEDSRSALAPVVSARTARATIVRVTMILAFLKRSRLTICTRRHAMS